jgi:hypothetical protein
MATYCVVHFFTIYLDSVLRIHITLMRNRICIRLFSPTGCTFLHIRLRLIFADSHHFDEEPDLDPAFIFPGIQIQLFTLMRICIRLPKMMLVHADPDPQHC